jgi:hypothetical protein
MNDRRDGARVDIEILENTPPWEWPEDAGEVLLCVLLNDEDNEDDRIVAAELAGNFVVINDELANALLTILSDGRKPEKLRAQAAISFGPALEQTDTDGFEDPGDLPISERMFHNIQKTLRRLYTDAEVPKEVRRRILEVGVRARENWHEDAVRAAYSSDNGDWQLTAVFCMRYVRGFDEQILEALDSDNPEIRCEAVCAAGNSAVDAAWPNIAGIVASERADKNLLLAAIEAAASIHPKKAPGILGDLVNSKDEDIAAAAFEAVGMAESIQKIADDDLF